MTPTMDTELKIKHIAQFCHEANRAYCHVIGDDSQRTWEEAEEWQRKSAIDGVRFALANPKAPASAQHDAWLDAKAADCWKYGPVKDPTKKEHPCMVPYSELPFDQRVKGHLFRAIVRAFVDAE